MTAFGYPETLVKEYPRWVVLARPAQVTLGSLVVICRENVTAFSSVSAEGFGDLAQVTGAVESCLGALWGYQKINYLMLMMVDPDVHFHVLPRYEKTPEFDGRAFPDKGWPKMPDLANPVLLEGAALGRLTGFLRDNWPT